MHQKAGMCATHFRLRQEPPNRLCLLKSESPVRPGVSAEPTESVTRCSVRFPHPVRGLASIDGLRRQFPTLPAKSNAETSHRINEPWRVRVARWWRLRLEGLRVFRTDRIVSATGRCPLEAARPFHLKNRAVLVHCVLLSPLSSARRGVKIGAAVVWAHPRSGVQPKRLKIDTLWWLVLRSSVSSFKGAFVVLTCRLACQRSPWMRCPTQPIRPSGLMSICRMSPGTGHSYRWTGPAAGRAADSIPAGASTPSRWSAESPAPGQSPTRRGRGARATTASA
jgi:hypothetical protein